MTALAHAVTGDVNDSRIVVLTGIEDLTAATAFAQRESPDFFRLNDTEWATKEDFIRNGGRCATFAPTEETSPSWWEAGWV